MVDKFKERKRTDALLRVGITRVLQLGCNKTGNIKELLLIRTFTKVKSFSISTLIELK